MVQDHATQENNSRDVAVWTLSYPYLAIKNKYQQIQDDEQAIPVRIKYTPKRKGAHSPLS